MPSIRCASVTLLAALAGTPGCRDSTGTATSPSQSPSPSSAFSLSGKVIKRPQPLAITLTGQVTDATTAGAIAGAIVSINGRYRGATDNAGRFSVAGLLDYGDNHNFTFAVHTISAR